MQDPALGLGCSACVDLAGGDCWLPRLHRWYAAHCPPLAGPGMLMWSERAPASVRSLAGRLHPGCRYGRMVTQHTRLASRLSLRPRPAPLSRHGVLLHAASEMSAAAESCTMRAWRTRDGTPGRQRRDVCGARPSGSSACWLSASSRRHAPLRHHRRPRCRGSGCCSFPVRTLPPSRPCGRGCVSMAGWRARTSPSSIAGRWASSIGSPNSRPNWFNSSWR